MESTVIQSMIDNIINNTKGLMGIFAMKKVIFLLIREKSLKNDQK